MNPTEQYPKRKNLRAEFHNYSGGSFFITICTHNKNHYFGEIHNGAMQFTEIGAFAHQALAEMAEPRPMSNTLRNTLVVVPQFVVMPNHIHAIYCLEGIKDMQSEEEDLMKNAISNIIGRLKQAVTRYARQNQIEFAWQRNFYDHIIRGHEDGNEISDYVAHNVQKWDADTYR
jgi:REP element-mobilizing transposase RayT